MEKPNENSSNRKWIIYTDRTLSHHPIEINSSSHIPFARDAPPSSLAPRQVGQTFSKASDGIVHFCRLGATDRNMFISRLRDDALGGASSHSLRLELLLSVKQYNIFTAMSKNAASIGLSMEALRHDIISPFNTSMPWVRNLPPSLRPTTLQQQIPHHPWIDLFPIASIRDALLQHEGEYDDEKLCHDIFGSCGKEQEAVGILVWGEAWDPFAYEISERVARKWLWLFHDCIDVIRSSNYWRLKRGEKRLHLTSYDCSDSSSEHV